MQTTTTVGLDIAKSVFQVHGVDANGNVVFCRQLKRRYVLTFFQKLPPCLVGIEACASSHYWSRELQALGHTVRLMPPAYVKAYVKRYKNDAADADRPRSLLPSRPGEFHPEPLTDPYVNLSIHTARVIARRLPPSCEKPQAIKCERIIFDI
jgi:transposase